MLLNHRTSSRLPGRTRVEAIVVILVIVVAVFIFWPQRHPPGNARLAICMSNLYQCGVAMAMYSVSNKGLLPVASSPGEQGWIVPVLREMGLRRSRSTTDPNTLSLAKLEVLQCPVRTSLQDGAFVDFLSNALDPKGPDATGTWSPPDKRKFVAASSYRDPGGVVLFIEAEREDRVVDFRDLPSVKTAREQWKAGPSSWQQGGVHNMSIWKGGHLPQGKNGINVDDKPGPRKVTREMHPSGRINAAFFDGHGQTVRRTTQVSQTEDYAYWLKLFGVKDPQKVAQSDDDLY
jgi:prepilin-type processing-associated H-X9-DG protein